MNGSSKRGKIHSGVLWVQKDCQASDIVICSSAVLSGPPVVHVEVLALWADGLRDLHTPVGSISTRNKQQPPFSVLAQIRTHEAAQPINATLLSLKS